ncbi:ankyrin repeat domain-containing protein [Oceanivirga salmonicida]|uniref:ankyrin repeat domain-containing protein n=1 Tax=Oceanivirga salmonicida TaxID=1769291 RepID=UPI00082B27CC|nr:ankyrin repeat domain-containing protein [Oceanivirga salmonicida]
MRFFLPVILFTAISFSKDTDYNLELYNPLKNNKNVQILNIKNYVPPVITAIENNDIDALKKEKIDSNINSPVLNKNLLGTAIYNNSKDASKYIMQKDNEQINEISSDNTLPIQNAVLKENEEILTLLLNNGAIIRKKDANGNDAYDLATKFGKGRMVKILRDKELKKYRKNKEKKIKEKNKEKSK